MRDMANLFLFTFLLTYLMYRLQNFIVSILKKYFKVKQNIIAVALYIILIGLLSFAIYKFVPSMINQMKTIITEANTFYKNIEPNNKVLKMVKMSAASIKIGEYTNQGLGIIVSYTTNIINFLFAMILSLFFLLEKNKIKAFTRRFKDSKASLVFNELSYFGRKFLNSFGKVIEAQFVISIINTILSSVCLYFLDFDKYIFGLMVMIFILGLIPVAGVIISLVPLSIIAYTVGETQTVLYVWGMIAVLHAIEAYFLNPKLMSQKTKLPVFYTLAILLFSEKTLGVWGLIIGIPIFMFILDLLEVNNSEILDEEEDD